MESICNVLIPGGSNALCTGSIGATPRIWEQTCADRNVLFSMIGIGLGGYQSLYLAKTVFSFKNRGEGSPESLGYCKYQSDFPVCHFKCCHEFAMHIPQGS